MPYFRHFFEQYVGESVLHLHVYVNLSDWRQLHVVISCVRAVNIIYKLAPELFSFVFFTEAGKRKRRGEKVFHKTIRYL